MSMMCVVDTHKVHHIYTWDTSSRMMTCRFHYLCLVPCRLIGDWRRNVVTPELAKKMLGLKCTN
jgi:hypothetical protein